MNRGRIIDRAMVLSIVLALMAAGSSRLRADSGTCSGQMITLPFMDVAANPFFCDIAEAYSCGLTNGTSSSTYSPSSIVTRDQMAAFITRTQDSAIRRMNRRAALGQWTQGVFAGGAMTDVDTFPYLVKSDGVDIWVASAATSTVSRVRASDGHFIESWTGASGARGVLVARGRIYVTGGSTPGHLYRFDPSQAAGDVVTVADLEPYPDSLTTDGFFIWTACNGSTFSNGGSICRINPTNGNVTKFSGFVSPNGILYDGSNIWMIDLPASVLYKLNTNGTIAQSITVGATPYYPAFDGTNIWVPNKNDNSVTVVRVKDSVGAPLASAFVLTTLTGNGLDNPICASFDGQRILVTNNSGDGVSLWKATDLSPLGAFSAPSGSHPYGACFDGVNFWITLQGTNKLARF